MVTFLTPLASNSEDQKGSIGPAFAVRIRTENQDQDGFCPFALREVSVLAEPSLGHLRYLLTDVPPQSNSPPDSVLCWARAMGKVVAHPRRPLRLEGKTTTGRGRNRDTRRADASSQSECGSYQSGGISPATCVSRLFYTSGASIQSQTAVKLNRVFFPRRRTQARSPGCGFAR